MDRALLMVCVVLAVTRAAPAQSNIHETQKACWSENAGWLNWRDAAGTSEGVFADEYFLLGYDDSFLSGYIWSENIGWIDVGDGNGPYSDTDGTNFGVNRVTTGDLYGLAWGENIGWIDFGWGFVNQHPARARFDDLEKRFRGYAWSENLGWINLDDGAQFVAIDVPTCPAAPYSLHDFVGWMGCFAGPDDSSATPACDCADLDGDGDVDLLDFAEVQNMFVGN